MLMLINPMEIKRVYKDTQFEYSSELKECLELYLNEIDILKINPLVNSKILLWYKEKDTDDLNFAKGYFKKMNEGILFVSDSGFRSRKLNEIELNEVLNIYFNNNKYKHIAAFEIDYRTIH